MHFKRILFAYSDHPYGPSEVNTEKDVARIYIKGIKKTLNTIQDDYQN